MKKIDLAKVKGRIYNTPQKIKYVYPHPHANNNRMIILIKKGTMHEGYDAVEWINIEPKSVDFFHWQLFNKSIKTPKC